MIRRLRRASMRVQIFLLATLPLLIFALVAGIRAPLREGDYERKEWARARAAQMSLLLTQMRLAQPESPSLFVVSGQHIGHIDIVPQAGCAHASGGAVLDADADGFNDTLVRLLVRQTYEDASGTLPHEPIAIRLDPDRTLIWRPAFPAFPTPLALLMQAMTIIAVILIPILLFTYYLSVHFSRSITEFAAAARRGSAEGSAQEAFAVDGAVEIRSLAISLNVMQERIRRMLEERTRMLWGLSHDLRTPLTRLRMRAERVKDQHLRATMLDDINRLASMIDDGMQYLKGMSVSGAPPRKVDLTSLLQTICADYVDVGCRLSFSGPRRLAYSCQPEGITRAVCNLVDNALRYATSVEILLEQSDDGQVTIDISDDGPGLPGDLKWLAVEPFFKSEPSRPSAHGGMGLGLSNAVRIAEAHGGSLILIDRQPVGLIARIQLPAAGAPAGAGRNKT